MGKIFIAIGILAMIGLFIVIGAELKESKSKEPPPKIPIFTTEGGVIIPTDN